MILISPGLSFFTSWSFLGVPWTVWWRYKSIVHVVHLIYSLPPRTEKSISHWPPSLFCGYLLRLVLSVGLWELCVHKHGCCPRSCCVLKFWERHLRLDHLDHIWRWPLWWSQSIKLQVMYIQKQNVKLKKTYNTMVQWECCPNHCGPSNSLTFDPSPYIVLSCWLFYHWLTQN